MNKYGGALPTKHPLPKHLYRRVHHYWTMVECDYCEEVFEGNDPDSQEYMTHLVREHYDDIEGLDSRRIENKWEGDVDEVREESRRSPLLIGGAAAGVTFAVGLVGSAAGFDPTFWQSNSDEEGWNYSHGHLEVVFGSTPAGEDVLEGSEEFYAEGESDMMWRMNVPAGGELMLMEVVEKLGVEIDSGGEVQSVPERVDDRFVGVEVEVQVNEDTAYFDQELQHGDELIIVVNEV